MSILDIEPAIEKKPKKPVRLLAPPSGRARQIGLGIFALWILTCIYFVAPEEQAVVTRFGAVIEPRMMPGVHASLPWPIDQVTKLKVQQLQRLVVGGDIPDSVLGRSQPLQSQWITGDQNIINMRVVVQYSVSVPGDYLFQSQDVARAVGAAVESEMARRIATRDVDAVLTTEKAAIQEEVRAASQKRINDYRSGVQLSTINIESVTPPPEAADSFRDVASARADAVRIVNQAEGYANDVIPKARGEARQLIEESEAYKQKAVNEAGGNASRFTQLNAEYSKAAQVTGDRLYAEAMEQILPKIRKMIVDRNGNLDLTIIRKADPPPTVAAPATKK